MSYGQLISIRVCGRGVENEYSIERSAATAPGDPLDRFAGYAATYAEWGTRHTGIAAQLDNEGAGTESVIIIYDRSCLVALDLGSNHDLPHTEVKANIEHVLRCDWTSERPRR